MVDNDKVDLEKLKKIVSSLHSLLNEETESSGRNRAIEGHIKLFLAAVLADQEIEVLKFFERNKDYLHDLTKPRKNLLVTKKQGDAGR